jgi:hypothetical protein
MPTNPTSKLSGPSAVGEKIAFQMIDRATTELTMGKNKATLTTFCQKGRIW